MMPAHFDEQWAEFREICEQSCILPGGETDWMWAAYGWTRLDPEQRQAAIQDVKERNLEDFSIKEALPQNYIKGRYWTRPHKKPKRVTERRVVVIEEPVITAEQVAKYQDYCDALFNEWWEKQDQRAMISSAEKIFAKSYAAWQFYSKDTKREVAIAYIKAGALKGIAPTIEEWAKVKRSAGRCGPESETLDIQNIIV